SAGSLGDDALTIVRINLLTAAALSQSRTNETCGPHEDNLAFRHRTEIELVDGDPPEVTFILRTILTSASNVAGWYWMRQLDLEGILSFAVSAARSDALEHVRAGAIRFLRLVGRLPTNTDSTTLFT